jgi:hypothetical protein
MVGVSLLSTQATICLSWYHEWMEIERECFFQVILDRVISDPLDDLSNKLAFSFGASSRTKFDDQLLSFSTWFISWDDGQKNLFLSELETIDQARVYRFYDRFKCLKL